MAAITTSNPKKTFKRSFDTETESLTISGGTRTTTFNLAEVPEELRIYLTLHGLAAKLSDGAALPAGATVAEKWDGIDGVWETLTVSRTWNQVREGGTGLLLSALIELYPAKSPESLREWLSAKTPKEKASLEVMPKISAIISRLRREKSADVDADELLAALDD